MTKNLVFIFAVCWMARIGGASEVETRTFQILPADVVQASIQQFQAGPGGLFVVRWTYTEAGAKRWLAFDEANDGRTCCISIGGYTSPPSEHVFRPIPPAFDTYAQWKEGWLKRRTDKIIGMNEVDANTIVAGLKGNYFDVGNEIFSAGE